MRIWGFKTLGFDSLSILGWLMFHGLDIAAVLVIPGASYFLWRRMKDRGAATGQRFAYDLVPLIALIVISVTGLLLTFSSLFLHGGGYQFLAILHMVSVVFTLIYIPFGKFFHIVQRPAAVGMQLFKYTGRKDDEVFVCRRCEEPIDTGPYVENLRGTMRDLRLGFDSWAEYCPRCKRVLRGSAYLSDVKKGFNRPRIRELLPNAAPSSPWTPPSLHPAPAPSGTPAASRPTSGTPTRTARRSCRPTAASAACSAGCICASTAAARSSASNPATTTSTGCGCAPRASTPTSRSTTPTGSPPR